MSSLSAVLRALPAWHRRRPVTLTPVSLPPGPRRARISAARSSISACRAMVEAVSGCHAADAAGRRRAGGSRGAAAGAGRPRRPAGRGAAGGPDAGPRQLVCAALQGVRQSLLAGHAPAFLVGAADQRRDHHHRHELRLGHRAGDHRGPDEARPQSARHQVRDHQPCAWRSRPGRRGVAEALRRQGRDGRTRLGVHTAASRHRRGRRAERATSPWDRRARS